VFEAFKTEEEEVAERGRQMSSDAIKAYRLASILLVVNALLLALLAVLTPGPGFPVVPVGIALLLARALHQLKSNWADAVVVIAVAGTSIQTSLQLWAQPFVDAILSSLGAWGVVGALVLLLTGEPGPSRRAAALAVFVILTSSSYLLALASLAARTR
jgi:membrane-bound ClpP family serine protease